MTCDAAGLLLVQIGRNQLMDSKLRALALGHARECRTCGLRLANERTLSAALGILADEHSQFAPPPSVEMALQAAYRQKFARRQKIRRMYSGAAVAAACLALVSIVQVTRHGAQGPMPAAMDAGASELAAIAEAADLSDGATGSDSFIPLPFAEPLAPYERAELQQVKLTRGTLTAMGLTQQTPDPDEPMNAEVVVGEDGVPRAVRIVN